MDSDGTLPRVKKRRRVNSKLNDDSKEILIKAKSADIFPKLQCMSSAHLSSENYFQSPISKLQNNTSVTFSESELSSEDSSDNYEDNVPVSGSFIPTISDSSDEFFSNADFLIFLPILITISAISALIQTVHILIRLKML